MADKFDPAPKDKHAADPKEAQKADKEMHDKLTGSTKSGKGPLTPIAAGFLRWNAIVRPGVWVTAAARPDSGPRSGR